MIALLQYPRNIDQVFANSKSSNYVLLAFAIILLGVWGFLPADYSLHVPDTNSYLRFDPYRAAGYPLFLHLAQSLSPGWAPIVFLQLGLFFTALLFLSISLKGFTSSFVAGFSLLVAVGANPAFVQYCFSLITESLFFSSLMLLVGLLLKRHGSEQIGSIFIIGCLIAWLILIKPVSWAFICVPVILILNFILSKKTVLKRTFAMLLGAALVFSAGSLYRFSVHQSWTSGSFLGNQLIGKLAFADFDPEKTPYPAASKHWLTLMEQSKSLRAQHTEGLNEQFIFSLNIYDYLRFRKMPEILQQADIPQNEQGRALNEIAFSIIRQAPGDYLNDVAINLFGLWTLAELQPASMTQEYNLKIAKIRPELLDEITPYRPEPQNLWTFAAIKLFLAIAATVNLIVIFLGLKQLLVRLNPLPSEGLGLFLMAVMIQSYFLLTASLQAGLIRYAITAWPLHLALTIAATVFLFDHYFNKSRPTN
ncbi:MAG: hypothetical protein GKR95_20835 [Gammaproteobacteria bacterium]|nr:hypothetical protein [Gammaproteobacteria bacterium]